MDGNSSVQGEVGLSDSELSQLMSAYRSAVFSYYSAFTETYNEAVAAGELTQKAAIQGLEQAKRAASAEFYNNQTNRGQTRMALT